MTLARGSRAARRSHLTLATDSEAIRDSLALGALQTQAAALRASPQRAPGPDALVRRFN